MVEKKKVLRSKVNNSQKGFATISLHNRVFVHIFLTIVILLIGIGGLLYYSLQKCVIRNAPETNNSNTPSETENITPSSQNRYIAEDCKLGGCSSELCLDKSAEDI